MKLYRFYDVSGRLLYVGISTHPVRRVEQHYEHKGWADEIRLIEIEECGDKGTAIKKERDAIRLEHPRYNDLHTVRYIAISEEEFQRRFFSTTPSIIHNRTLICRALQRFWHNQDISLRDIVRHTSLSRNTVRSVISGARTPQRATEAALWAYLRERGAEGRRRAS